MAAYDESPTSVDGAVKLAIWLELQVQTCGHSGQPSPPSGNVSNGQLAPPLPSQSSASEPVPETAA